MGRRPSARRRAHGWLCASGRSAATPDVLADGFVHSTAVRNARHCAAEPQRSLADGLAAFALLIALQFGVTWLSVRVGWLRRFATGELQMLFYRGAFLPRPMRACRVTQAEIRAAIRASGHLDLSEIGAVVFDTDASFSIVDSAGSAAQSSLEDVKTPADSGVDAVARSLRP